ncbi:uncharacterized protein LOC117115334 [Anneissia japonica]|uniref:uncharacterized protein LOC117115334 n=1 Tax=Anneissia japonica TaxID=1529436 RepID=UPI001425B75E|nr:uncharacterized protein LOC117115334 [Anneissia japonica]XP_033114975.1 uncharacterized protein LOC117115334 [Anneissia japonica]
MKPNDNGHFCSARVKYCMQFSAAHPTNCAVYSVDNKNKITIGTDVLATDRRVKIHKLFPVADKPIYLDHDFPSRSGNLITPCGYMRLTLHDPPRMSSDDNGRPELVVQRSGPVHIINRGPKTKCNVASHVNDMLPLLQDDMRNGKSIVSIVADGGCDFHTGHQTNLLYYSRLFRDSHVDLLMITAYAPGQSALNPIEHVWGPCTQALTSVTLPDRLTGEEMSPWEQNLTDDELRVKEDSVYDAAMSNLCKYWGNVRFGGIPVSTSYISSSKEEVPYNDYEHAYNIMSCNSGKKF